MYLCEYPEVQEKAHKEILEQVGLTKDITIDDTDHLQYIQALIQEVNRHCPKLAFGTPRWTKESVTVNGYTIPKGMNY